MLNERIECECPVNWVPFGADILNLACIADRYPKVTSHKSCKFGEKFASSLRVSQTFTFLCVVSKVHCEHETQLKQQIIAVKKKSEK